MRAGCSYCQDEEAEDQDCEFRAKDTFSFRDKGPENRWKRHACMATKGRHALAIRRNQEKKGGGRWNEGARLGPEAAT